MNFLSILVLVLIPSIVFCNNISLHQQAALPPVNFGLRSDFSQSGSHHLNVCQNPSKYGFTQRFGTNKYYAIADLMMRWIEGENYCQSFGAHLPVSKNMDDVNFFRCN